MSTRFSRADSAEIWTHLNTLDDDIQSALDNANSALTQAPLTALPGGSITAITTRGVYPQQTAANVTSANGYPSTAAGTIGVLEVTPSADGSVVWQRWSSALGSWLRTYAASVWGSWLPLGSNLTAKATKATAGPSISAANTLTQITGLTAGYDDASMINVTTGVATAPVPGVYRARLFFPWSSFGSAYARTLSIIKGTTSAGTVVADLTAPNQTGKWHAQLDWEDACASGDQFTFWVSTTASGSTGAEASTTAIPPVSITFDKVR